MKYILTILFATSIISVFAQEKTTIEVEQEVYKNAKRYRDFETARSALYRMIALSDKKDEYRDTLAQFYFETGSYTECILLTSDIISKFPNKVGILNIRAISEQTIGLNKAALEDYEKLNILKPSLSNLYQIATLQYGLGRFGECDVSINKLLTDQKSMEETISIIIGQNQQDVILAAAVYNMKGVMYKDLKKDEEAKLLFSKALEIQPDFALAKGNLEITRKEDEPVKEIATDSSKESKKKSKKKK